MFTRSTTVDTTPDSIDRGIAHVQDEVLPAVTQMPGCVGMSMVVDRSSGRCIVATAWESEQAMTDSREKVRPLRDRAMEILGGTPQVEEWEVAVMHRKRHPGEGACARIVRFRMDPAHMDRAIDAYRMAALPTLDDLEGFCSASFMVNRDTGMAVSSAAYESRDALERTEERVQALRSRFGEESGAELLSVEMYDLVMAHLHVPEMA